MRILLSFVLGIVLSLPASAKDQVQPDVDLDTLFRKLDKNGDKQLSLHEFESMSKFLRVAELKKNAEPTKDQPTPDQAKIIGDAPKKTYAPQDEPKKKIQPDQGKIKENPNQDKPKVKPDQGKGDKEEPKKKIQPDQGKVKENPDQPKDKANPDQGKPKGEEKPKAKD